MYNVLHNYLDFFTEESCGQCTPCRVGCQQLLKGVEAVKQGWIASEGKDGSFSEAVILKYDPKVISLKTLIEIHLHTHKSTSNHSMRKKYRSAVYAFSQPQSNTVSHNLEVLQKDFASPLVTRVLPFKAFKPSAEEFQEYYRKNPEKPFCARHINPKLQWLLKHHRREMKSAFVIN